MTYDYDQIGEMTAMTDQNGTTHDYTYDGVGRLLTDTIASFCASLDSDAQYVNSIQYAYKVCGRLLSVTSYNDYSPNHPTEASVVNQVLYQYDTNGNLDAEYQAHGGPVDTATSLYVGYGCDDSTAVVNGVTTADTGWRPTTLEYPTTAGTATTRLLTYSYGDSGSSDDAINRLQSIGDGTETAGVPTTPDELASYAYLGVATIAKEDYTQLQIGLDYSGLDDSYSALDQFNRVVDQIWAGYGSNSSAGTLDGYAYGYNLQGNVSYRQNLTASTKALDQIFGYDDIEQLTSLAQGNLAVNGQGQPVLTDGSVVGFGQRGPRSELDAGRPGQLVRVQSNEHDGPLVGRDPDPAGQLGEPDHQHQQYHGHALGAARNRTNLLRRQRQHDHHAPAGRGGRWPDLHL